MKTGTYLLFAVLAASPPAMAADTGVSHYVCTGSVSSESIFEAGSAVTTEKNYRLTVNRNVPFVKRDQELAAGCLTQQIEICRCELGPEQIRCLSLGLNRNGQEISADFTLDLQTAIMQVTARQSDPQSGKLIEIQGKLNCSLLAPTP